MQISKTDIFKLDSSIDLLDIFCSLGHQSWSLHDGGNFVNINQVFIERTIHGSQEEQRTEELQHERLNHDDISCR